MVLCFGTCVPRYALTRELADGSGSGLGKGWIPWYSTTGFLPAPGDGGAGTSYHLTSLSGASVQLKFYGTEVYLYGDINNSSYTASIDGGAASSFSPSNSALLYSATGLQEGSHSVTLTAKPTGSEQFAFDYAVISTPYEKAAPSELFVDNTDSSLSYSGTWSPENAPGVPNATVSHVWEQTVGKDASVSLTVSDAVGVAIYGMADWGGWVYNVSVDDRAMSFNGSTFWQVPDALMFYQGGLDPTKNHTVTLLNPNSDPTLKLNLNSFRVFSTGSQRSASTTGGASATGGAPPPASSSAADTSAPSKHTSVNAGVIVGPIVAVLVLAFAAGFFWRCFRNKRRRNSILPDALDAEMVPSPQAHRPVFRMMGQTHGGGGSSTYSLSAAAGTSPSEWDSTPYYDEATASESGTRSPPSTYAPSSTGFTGTTVTRGEKSVLSYASPTSPLPAPVSAPAPAATVVPATGLDPHDVDRLVELIAQRIDPAGRQHDATAPPEYRGY
ncbi:hypothetical protein HMN09_00897400 [Mycena chlorophos]|uniref:Transmembrane protein n=1 Tax=Mycena chlorophos TaxID=658473 RepID=A0A8H6SNM9_MYCCL|nr:hypothetical protein HMN09_00897400 [Mycena chlorophos]